VLILSKWLLPVDPTRVAVVEPILDEKARQQKQQKLEETTRTLQRLDDLILQYESAIQTTKDRMMMMESDNDRKESYVSLDDLWQILQRQTSALEMASSSIADSASSSSSSSSAPPPIRIKQLLQVTNLDEKFPSTSQMNKAFHLAVQELHKYMKKMDPNTSATLNDWKALVEFFRHFEFPNYESSPHSWLGHENDRVTTEHDKSFSSSIEQHLKIARERILQQFLAQQRPPNRIHEDDTTEIRYAGVAETKESVVVPLSFPETWRTIRTILKDVIVNRTAVATSSATTSSSSSQSWVSPDCIQSPNQVVPWIEAGIEAIHNQKDIREAILHALEEDGYDTSRIILDADLSESSFSFFRHGKNRNVDDDDDESSIPLRHVLDNPTLHATSAYIDAILDILGGHHDGLDAFLDRHVYANVPDETQVGRVVIAAFLRAIDPIRIPQHPHKHLIRWIQKQYGSK
jgi:hypothetical protein